MTAESQMKLALQDAKFNMFMQEMRDRDNQRAEDMRELRTALNNNVRNMFITVIIGVGAMVVAVMMK